MSGSYWLMHGMHSLTVVVYRAQASQMEGSASSMPSRGGGSSQKRGLDDEDEDSADGPSKRSRRK
jgi:hypothetical protein